jgi:hypothetical protein
MDRVLITHHNMLELLHIISEGGVLFPGTRRIFLPEAPVQAALFAQAFLHHWSRSDVLSATLYALSKKAPEEVISFIVQLTEDTIPVPPPNPRYWPPPRGVHAIRDAVTVRVCELPICHADDAATGDGLFILATCYRRASLHPFSSLFPTHSREVNLVPPFDFRPSCMFHDLYVLLRRKGLPTPYVAMAFMSLFGATLRFCPTGICGHYETNPILPMR